MKVPFSDRGKGLTTGRSNICGVLDITNAGPREVVAVFSAILEAREYGFTD